MGPKAIAVAVLVQREVAELPDATATRVRSKVREEGEMPVASTPHSIAGIAPLGTNLHAQRTMRTNLPVFSKRAEPTQIRVCSMPVRLTLLGSNCRPKSRVVREISIS